ncbi:MAG: ATP-dependent sacrificial sulfur transferase LarE [Pseudomonadaceae bacterium]|nr:ATP-dependent sacrificial sulfur transferase LarE [Pseudomonadaceae bacterium]
MTETISAQLKARYDAVKAAIADCESVVVAFSGGVDSSLVAYIAGEVLGEKALAVTSGSASLKRSDLSLARRLAVDWGMPHRVIVTDELANPDYRANPTNRCYFCKTTLYDALAEIAATENYAVIINGTNTDDLGDHRPGLIAASEHAVRQPLVEAGLCKADVRALAAHLGLDNADKPQSACLSSRFPYGSHITRERLAQVEQAEDVLAELGFREYRVRHHEEVARLEIATGEMAAALEHGEELQRRIRDCGFNYVAMDVAGFRSGSMNEQLGESVVRLVDAQPPAPSNAH